MLGIRFAKMDPTVYVLHYRHGALVREGAGLSLLYFAPISTLVAVPMSTSDLPFAFQEVTSDFQTVTLQGQLSYRVVDPKRLAALLNYSVDAAGQYLSDDPDKLGERLLMTAQAELRGLVQAMALRQALVSAESLAERGLERLKESELVEAHGLELLGLSLASLKPTPETSKALEAEAREALLKDADRAIYARRNAAIEEERTVKETELETERAVEEGRRKVREAKMQADIALEESRAALIDRRVANDRKDADARAYALERTLAPVKDSDWRLLLALGGQAADGRMLLASAFETLAENAGKIGNLTITPELLSALTAGKK